ncbi:hypothetical protein [Helicobacter trogontum]|uniref:Uncharacterized protein n=2 Tax=Helicobacter trogontum TaxID=50960 RepID=A0A4U8S9R6_9HELI|nr:hypothetical protein [Helicobacter trogontum]TLD82567.1 hypothetical protein LS81_007390 [Helicobacter trogontum]
MLENIKTKVESDFTHTKLYDLKVLLNDCNTFISYFVDKLRIKNNEISLESFLSNVSKASMYEYLVYLFDNKEKGYYKLAHHKDIQVSDFLQAQARLKELLANFSDDELELSKPNDSNGNVDVSFLGLNTAYEDKLGSIWLDFETYSNISENSLDSMSQNDFIEIMSHLMLKMQFFSLVTLFKAQQITQDEIIIQLQQSYNNLVSAGLIEQDSLNSLDNFIRDFDVVENAIISQNLAFMPNISLDSMKQVLSQSKQICDMLKGGELQEGM